MEILQIWICHITDNSDGTNIWKFSKFSICWMLDVGFFQWMSFTQEVPMSNLGPLQLVLGASSSYGCHWCHGNVAFGQVEYDDLSWFLYTCWSENIYPYDDLNIHYMFSMFIRIYVNTHYLQNQNPIDDGWLQPKNHDVTMTEMSSILFVFRPWCAQRVAKP